MSPLPWMRPRPRRVGLVISGGGSRASFELGALRYLYEREGIAPQVIAGTSVGSVLAAVLAQSADPAGQRAHLARVERLWRDMEHSAEIFAELEWFSRLREQGPVLQQTITGLQRLRDTPRMLLRTVVRDVRRTAGGPTEATEVTEVVEEPGVAVSSETAADGGVAANGGVAADGEPQTWHPVNVVDLITGLRSVARARPDLEIIVRGARHEQSLYRPGPIVDRLLDPEVFAAERVAASGVTLRVAVVGLESGELRFVTETGRLVDREDRPVEGEPVVDLVDAIRASTAIPAVFPPVRLGEEHYVDGGVREVLPAELVIEHLGVDRCYVVVASPPGVQREDSYAGRDLLSIVLRATSGIMSAEVLRDEVAYARSRGAVVVEPVLDVHDSLTVDPGLTAIAIDYGWLRAAEEVEGATPAERAATARVIELRKRIWAAEVRLFGPAEGEPAEIAEVIAEAGARPAAHDALDDGVLDDGATPPATDLDALVALKHELRAAVAAVPAGRLPEDADRWWRGFEGHPFPLPDAGWATEG